VRRFLVKAAVTLALAAACCTAGAVSWQLERLDGPPLGPADFAGRWVVVNFWATWCGPCREEMPELEALDRERDDLVVLGVAWDDAPVERLAGFVHDAGVSYPILTVDTFHPPAGLEPPRVLPTTVLIGPGGGEVDRYYGPVTRRLLDRAIANARGRNDGGAP